MSFSITQAFRNQYNDNVQMAVQQMGSRLRPYVTEDRLAAQYGFYERLNPTQAYIRTTRHGDVKYADTIHSRRRATLQDVEWADLIDRQDTIRSGIDFQSPYVMNAAFAIGRQIDQFIINGAIGTSYTGAAGNTPVTLPSSQVVPVNYVETGTATNSNLTIQKLRAARLILEKNEAIMDGEPIVLVFTASQEQSMLRTIETQNIQYNTVRTLVNGRLETFMGFDPVRTQLLPFDASGATYRTCLVFPKSAIYMTVGKDVETSVDRIATKGNSIQVLAQMTCDATRMYEEKVVSILCDENY